MQFIIFDLEFNQDYPSLMENSPLIEYFNDQSSVDRYHHPFEIIQVGALKLDENFLTIDTFNRYIKPSFYSNISPAITDLTGITIELLANEEPFRQVMNAFITFIENPSDTIFCVWGTADIKELYKNSVVHQLNFKEFPQQYINIQPYASSYFGLPSNQLLKLQTTIEMLQLPNSLSFHNALHDAYYTAEIFKKIYNPSIPPVTFQWDMTRLNFRSSYRKPRKVIDFSGLISQFEKMYQRNMTEEEQAIIKLAYQMGKTGQFLL